MAPFLVSFIYQLDTVQSPLSESQVQDRPGPTGQWSGLCRTVLTDDGAGELSPLWMFSSLAWAAEESWLNKSLREQASKQCFSVVSVSIPALSSSTDFPQ